MSLQRIADPAKACADCIGDEKVAFCTMNCSSAVLHAMADTKPFEFDYTNYRGEHSRRRAIPIRVYFGSNQWHQTPQWLMVANDLDKGETREFAMRDMRPA